MFWKGALSLLLLALCASANAQRQTGKMVFYRESGPLNRDYDPPVFCDGVEMARVADGTSVEVVASTGRHSCVAESVQDPATTIDVTPGGVAYLRVDFTQTVARHAFLIAATEAEYARQKALPPIPDPPLRKMPPADFSLLFASRPTPRKESGLAFRRESASNFGDLSVTATNLATQANYAANGNHITVYLTFNNIGKADICASLTAKLITTSGSEYSATSSGGLPIRELPPGATAKGSFSFDVTAGVQPLELVLGLEGNAIRCHDSGDLAREQAFVPAEIRLDLHDLPGPPAGNPSRPGVGGVSFPHCIYCPNPQYSPEALALKLEGTVVLQAMITTDGTASEIQIVKSLGHGLDERAVEAIRSWRFQPAAEPNGRPVPTIVPIEVTFRLLNPATSGLKPDIPNAPNH